MKVRDLFARLNSAGWKLDRIRGSHHVFVHSRALRSITVPVHSSEIPEFYARSILKQANRAIGKEEDK